MPTLPPIRTDRSGVFPAGCPSAAWPPNGTTAPPATIASRRGWPALRGVAGIRWSAWLVVTGLWAWSSLAPPSIVRAAEPPARLTAASSPSAAFETDVMAVLSKASCNAGTCHGNLNGKGGLALSLFGENPLADYDQLVRAAMGRRINRLDADQSLILAKATAQIPHEGGKRFEIDSPEYRILSQWIAGGAAPYQADAAKVLTLQVTPIDEVIWMPEQELALKVNAIFSDGSQRDVTRMAVYEPSDPLVRVTDEGVVRFQQPGSVTVLVRYLDGQLPVRLACRTPQPDFVWPEHNGNNLIDRHIFARLRQLKISPADRCSDHVFIRRLYLDLLGILPTAQEAQAFVADTDPTKRQRLIDRCINRPEFATLWALKWSDLLRNEEKTLDATGVEKLHRWLMESFADDQPLNQIVQQLLTGQGSTYDNPPANYWRALREPFVRSETTAQVFLGVRLQCAKCHNHPFDRWSQDEYYQWASLFTGIDYEIIDNKRRDSLDQHEFVGDQIVKQVDSENVTNVRTRQPAAPKLLGSDQPIQADRLEQLAQWVTADDNSLFVNTQVNRIWFQLMGRGLIEPIDDVRLTNPASHPELMQALSEQFAQNGFSVKSMVRLITQSETYQLASELDQSQWGEAEQYDDRLYARAVIRRLSAEQILDAQSQVLGLPARFSGYPAGTRASEIAGTERVRRKLSSDDEFLRRFGKPERLLACECERTDEATLGQALSLIGSESLHSRLVAPNNRIGRLLDSGATPQEVVDQLFWTALARPASDQERQAVNQLIDELHDPRAALEDLTWALLNAKELLFRN